jgi:hypothetical protein
MARLLITLLQATLIGMVTVAFTENIGSLWWSPPPGVDLSKPAEVAKLMSKIPLANKVLVTLAWVLGPAVASGWAARRDPENGLIVGALCGVLFTSMTLANLMMIPHPAWMAAIGLLLPFPASMIAAWRGFRSNLG